MATSGIDLSGEITERLNNPNPGKITVLSYVDSGGQPHVSVRASLHVHSPKELALWVREGYVGTMTPGAQIGAPSNVPAANPHQSGVLTAIEKNPLVSVLYREGRSTYVFSGHARVVDDDDVRDQIFASIPPGEQNHSTLPSGERTGTPVIIDLDHVIGGSLGEGGVIASHVEMTRG